MEIAPPRNEDLVAPLTVGKYLQTWKLNFSSTKTVSGLNACVLHQRTTFPSSQASNLLSFVAMEPHCL